MMDRPKIRLPGSPGRIKGTLVFEISAAVPLRRTHLDTPIPLEMRSL